MKRSLTVILVAVLVLEGTCLLIPALPIAGSNTGREYLMGVSDLGNWSCGIYSRMLDRDIDIRGIDSLMKSKSIIGYVGYDFVRWFTTYVLAGQNESEFGNMGYGDDEFEYGFGMYFNLLDQDILDPTLFEDKIRINAGWQYSESKTESGGSDVEWSEICASLTLSIVNDLDGNKRYVPNSIALFAGPVYSDIDSSIINEKDVFGYTAGIQVFYTEKVSFDIGVEKFESDTYVGGVNVRF